MEYRQFANNGKDYIVYSLFNWSSLCHNADVMENTSIYVDVDYTDQPDIKDYKAWGQCRRCGNFEYFEKTL